MYRKNTRHLQENLFDFLSMLPDTMRQQVLDSEEYAFYQLLLCRIEEDDFRCLYTDVGSRPNAPVNSIVTALFLMHRRGWSYAHLMENVRFNLLTKVALGLRTLDEMPFVEATLFNFLQRLNTHFTSTGENLLERVFDRFTSEQLETLKLKTSIQRTDSFQAASNIRTYTRLLLLVEVLIRLHRVLRPEDRERHQVLFAPYVEKTAGQFVHRIAKVDTDAHLASIGTVYHQVHTSLAEAYRGVEAFEVFSRVYHEQFLVVDDRVIVRPGNEIGTSSVQSPDDLEATYRRKSGDMYQGQVVNVVETAHPDNPVQLVTDVAVARNNRDDSAVLQERLGPMLEKTPDLKELHHDGSYGSEENDTFYDTHEMTAVQTGIRGFAAHDPITITEGEDNEYTVCCAGQQVMARPTSKGWKAEFSAQECAGCAREGECKLKTTKYGRVYYFNREDYLKKKRLEQIEHIDEKHRTLRANVEATVKEFKRTMRNGKLKVRGAFRTGVFAYAMAITINIGRIYRHRTAQRKDMKAELCPT